MQRSASRPPSVCVLILNYNGWRDTVECLESVFRLRYPRMQVVVCDNRSGDGSLERIAEWARGERPAPATAAGLPGAGEPPVAGPVPYVVLDRAAAEAGGAPADVPLVLVQNGSNRGFAAGNNVGLRYALARGADYAWLLNPDTVVDPGALDALVAAAEARPNAGMVGGRLLHYDQPARLQAAGGGTLTRWNGMSRACGEGAGQPPAERMTYVHGACMLVRMEVARTVGLMDERYFLYSEEVDWCLRASRAGWTMAYAQECRVWHKEGTSVGVRSPFQEYHSMRSRLLLVRSHAPWLFPLGAAYGVVRCVLPKVVRRQPARLGATLRAYRDFFLHRTAS